MTTIENRAAIDRLVTPTDFPSALTKGVLVQLGYSIETAEEGVSLSHPGDVGYVLDFAEALPDVADRLVTAAAKQSSERVGVDTRNEAARMVARHGQIMLETYTPDSSTFDLASAVTGELLGNAS